MAGMTARKAPRYLLVSGGRCRHRAWTGVIYHVGQRRGIEHYAWHVTYTDQRGRRRRRTFFIGSETTWTRARERAALAAARAFRAAYEHWVKRGGVHPLDTGKHEWSARAA